MASAVGIAAICTWPARPRLSASTSCRIARVSATMRRAHPFALGREAPEPRSALHQQHPERVLKLLDAGRQCGLADVARLGRAPEMLLACKRNHKFKLVDHGFTSSSRATADRPV